MLDFDLITDSAARGYLKRVALETNVNFLSRVVAQSRIRVTKDKKALKNTIAYKLNVRPNTDSSATDFWKKVIHKLLMDNEVLIVKSDTDDLLIADDFERVERALYEDSFKHVMVKDYEFKRTFEMKEVIYMSYNNAHLESYINSMFEDYGELFGRMMDAQLRKNQLRLLVGVKSGGGGFSTEQTQRLKNFLNKLYDKIKTDSVAIMPQLEGFEVNEIASSALSANDSGADELQKLKKIFIEDVAKILGIPPAIIHGDVVEVGDLHDTFVRYCIEPLIKLIEDELNAKLLTRSEYLDENMRIEILGLNRRNPLEHASSIDKLISSRSFNNNEIRELFGYEPVEGLDEFVMTKNYEDVKGGDNE